MVDWFDILKIISYIVCGLSICWVLYFGIKSIITKKRAKGLITSVIVLFLIVLPTLYTVDCIMIDLYVNEYEFEVSDFFNENKQKFAEVTKEITENHTLEKDNIYDELSLWHQYLGYSDLSVSEYDDDRIEVDYKYIRKNNRAILPFSKQYIVIHITNSESDVTEKRKEYVGIGFWKWKETVWHT